MGYFHNASFDLGIDLTYFISAAVMGTISNLCVFYDMGVVVVFYISDVVRHLPFSAQGLFLMTHSR